MVITIVVQITLSLPTWTATALKNTLDTSPDWQDAVRGTTIMAIQGSQYLCNFTMQTSLTKPSMNQQEWPREWQSGLFESQMGVHIVGNSNQGMLLDGDAGRALQGRTPSAKGAPVYVTLIVTANMIYGSGTTIDAQLESAYGYLQDEFADFLRTPDDGGLNLFTTNLRQISSSPQIPLSQVTVAAVGSPDSPNTWTARLGIGYVGTPPPSPAPSPEPTPAPTVAPTTWQSNRPTTSLGGSALTSIGASASKLSPAALGGILAGIILLVGAAAFLFFRRQCGSKDEESELMEGQGHASDQYMDDGGAGHLQQFGDEDDYVERPSGGVEMLENPVHRRASQQPFNPMHHDVDDSASQMDAVYDHEHGFLGPGRGPLPPRSQPADPYQRFGLLSSPPPPPGISGPGAAPQQRLSMSVRGGMTTEITGPPLGLSDGGGLSPAPAPQARAPMKRFSVAPTLAEFSQGQGVTARLGAPRAEFASGGVLAAGPMPPAPRHLRPFQPHSPMLPLQTQPIAPPTITLSPSKRLSNKLEQQGPGHE